MRQPGPLLASGRDSEIFDYGPGLVLRRSRSRRSMEKEATTMRYVTERGYPAPRVEELSADGSELVMERIVGPTMLEDLQKRPWTYRRHAATLASLHRRLHHPSGSPSAERHPRPRWPGPHRLDQRGARLRGDGRRGHLALDGGSRDPRPALAGRAQRRYAQTVRPLFPRSFRPRRHSGGSSRGGGMEIPGPEHPAHGGRGDATPPPR